MLADCIFRDHLLMSGSLQLMSNKVCLKEKLESATKIIVKLESGKEELKRIPPNIVLIVLPAK